MHEGAPGLFEGARALFGDFGDGVAPWKGVFADRAGAVASAGRRIAPVERAIAPSMMVVAAAEWGRGASMRAVASGESP